MSKYLVGIDGGASRSKCLVASIVGTEISSVDGGSLNPLSVGWDQFERNINSLIKTALGSISSGEVKAVCAGLAGTGNETVQLRTVAEIQKLTETAEVHVISDAMAALWGAFGGQAGLLLIAGTGSICMGMDDEGNIARSGGFGRLLGDEGGGYWIAVEAIKAALMAVDGRRKETALSKALCEAFNLKDVRDIIPSVYDSKLSPEDLADFARSVLSLSGSDAAASHIIKYAGEHLAELVTTTARKLSLDNPKIAFWGGLWKSAKEELQHSCTNAINDSGFSCEIVPPQETAERGAIRFLQQLIT